MDDAPSLIELMDGRPVYSDTFELKGQKVKFKLLDEREVDWCRVAAQKKTYLLIKGEFDDDKDIALDLMKNHVVNHDSHTDWHDCFVLSIALKTEEGAPISGIRDPYALVEKVADLLSPHERSQLIERYLDFVDENDPGALTDEQINDIIEELKKKPSIDSLKPLGSRALRSLLVILVQDNLALGAESMALEAELEALREAK